MCLTYLAKERWNISLLFDEVMEVLDIVDLGLLVGLPRFNVLVLLPLCQDDFRVW